MIGVQRVLCNDEYQKYADRAERLPAKCTIQLRAGDVLRMLTRGGGGWGTPES